MKQVKLNFKGTYEEAVDYIYHNISVKEPTEYEFTRVIEYNHKKRKYYGKSKGEFSYTIKLNDNKHKENLYRKLNAPTYGYSQEYFEMMGVD